MYALAVSRPIQKANLEVSLPSSAFETKRFFQLLSKYVEKTAAGSCTIATSEISGH
jgi:hypothetical protein